MRCRTTQNKINSNCIVRKIIINCITQNICIKSVENVFIISSFSVFESLLKVIKYYWNKMSSTVKINIQTLNEMKLYADMSHFIMTISII